METIILFSGGGWTNSFHYGVAHFIQDYFISDNRGLKFGGVSGGALVAAGLALDCNMRDVHEENMSTHPCSPTRDVITEATLKVNVGDTAWRNVSDRLFISISKPNYSLYLNGEPRFKEVCISKFDSQAHGSDIIYTSCHYPILGGLLRLNLLETLSQVNSSLISLTQYQALPDIELLLLRLVQYQLNCLKAI